MKPTAGLAAIRSARSSSPWIEIMIRSGGDGPGSACNRPATSNPLSAPRSTSSSTTSGLNSAVCRRASSPSEAIATTSTPSRCRSRRAERRNPALSSTIRQRRAMTVSIAAGPAGHIPASRKIARRVATRERCAVARSWGSGRAGSAVPRAVAVTPSTPPRRRYGPGARGGQAPPAADVVLQRRGSLRRCVMSFSVPERSGA